MRGACGICSIYTTEDAIKLDEMQSLIDQNRVKLDSIVEAKNEEDEEKKEEEAGTKSSAETREQASPVKEVRVIELGEPRDFDTNPTDLYLYLMRKDWKAAKDRCLEEASEASIPIYRKEADGNLRWKLLPIHACVIFGAPVDVFDTLHNSFPDGVVSVDDQGMVPLHLAIRMASPNEVIEKLVTSSPETLEAKDRKGRTPRDLVARHPDPNTQNELVGFLDSLQLKNPTVESQPAPAEETGEELTEEKDEQDVKPTVVETSKTVETREEQVVDKKAEDAEDDPASIVLKGIETPRVDNSRAKPVAFSDRDHHLRPHDKILETLRVAHETAFESLKIEHTQTVQIMKITQQKEMDALKKKNKEAFENLRAESMSKQAALNERVLTLTTSLETLQEEHSKLLVDFKEVAENEAAFRSEHDELKDAAESAYKSKTTTESANKAVITNLVNQVGDLQSQLTAEKSTREALEAKLFETEDKTRNDVIRNSLQISVLERQLGQITYLKEEAETKLSDAEATKADLLSTKAALLAENSELTEKASTAQKKLEEVTVSEQELAWKTSSMNQKLKELQDEDATQQRIMSLEEERKELKNTVETLSVKLYKVVGFLDEMVQEQDAIIVESMTTEGDATQESDEDRHKLLTNVTSMKEQIGAVIDSVIDGMPDVEQDATEDEDVNVNEEALASRSV